MTSTTSSTKMKEIKGDLLDFPEGINVIVHGANTMNKMRSGIAKQIAARYPQAVAADHAYYCICKGLNESMMGTASVAEVEGKGRIYNLYQQSTTRSTNPEKSRHVDYEGFYNGLLFIRKNLEVREVVKDTVIGFPKNIACGLAGGDWNIIRAMIESVFGDINTVIVERVENDNSSESGQNAVAAVEQPDPNPVS